MFNRTFQLQSRRGGLVSCGDVLEELVERAADRQRFYRPARRPKPGAAAQQRKRRMENLLAGLQLELFPVEESAEEMFERLFPA